MPSTVRGAFPYPAGVDNWKQLRLQIQALAQQVGTATALYSHADPRPTAGTPGLLHRNPTTGLVSYDTGTAWVELLTRTSTITKTVRVPHTFTISGEVLVPSGDTSYIPPFFVPVPVGQTVTYRGLRSFILSGTSVTFSIRVGGVDIAASQTAGTSFASSVVGAGAALADGQALQLVVTAVSGTPKNMSVTLYLDYTV